MTRTARVQRTTKESDVLVERSDAPIKLAALTALARTSDASWAVSDAVWMAIPKPKGK